MFSNRITLQELVFAPMTTSAAPELEEDEEEDPSLLDGDGWEDLGVYVRGSIRQAIEEYKKATKTKANWQIEGF